jgi:phage terminase small subunit
MPSVHETTLTIKQRKFLAAYLGEANRNAQESARIAGYKHPRAQANQILKNVAIQKRIEKADERVDQALIMTVEERKVRLTEIAQDGEDSRSAIKAIDVLNKMEPVYVQRHEMNFDGMDVKQLNEESAEAMRADGWICISPDDPAHARHKELLE